MNLHDGGQYDGEWNPITQKRHGRGKQVWNDGTIYEGSWKDDKAHGKGRIVSMNSLIVEGSLPQDKI